MVEGPGRSEVRRKEGQPDDEGGIDTQRYVPRFVKVVRQFACLERVVRTHQDEQDVARQRDDEPMYSRRTRVLHER